MNQNLISLCFAIHSTCYSTIKNLKHLRNLKKWHKLKRSHIFLRFKYNILWVLIFLSTVCNFAVWTGKHNFFFFFCRLIGRITMDCKYIFNTKKTHAIYHFNQLFGVCHIYHSDLLSLVYIEVWSGLEAFWRAS